MKVLNDNVAKWPKRFSFFLFFFFLMHNHITSSKSHRMLKYNYPLNNNGFVWDAVEDLHRTLTVMYWFVLIGSLSLLNFGLGIRPHFCTHLAPSPIVLLRCPPLFFYSVNRALVLCSELPVDFLVVSAIAKIILFVACVLSPVGPSQMPFSHFVHMWKKGHMTTSF